MSVTDANPALTLNWSFGTSTSVRNNVLNLSDGYSERICYLAAHTAVIYDKRTRRQIFLQGHCNAISCLASTEDRSIIITTDVGNESLLVLWNARTGAPIKSIKRPHSHGVLAVDVSPQGDWLATVSAADPATGEQEVALWSLSSLLSDPAPRPAVLTAIPAGDTQLAVKFNMNNPAELMTNGRRRVYFWVSQYPSSGRFKYYSPPLRAKDFKQSVGDFVSSVFVPGSTQALTATHDGDLVVWDEQGITAQVGTRATDRRAIKLMRIHQQAITFLGTVGDYIVSGGHDGFIRFYDPLLRIVAWFEDLGAGPIKGVSFSAALPDRAVAGELADTLNRFLVPDFVVATEESRVVAVQAASFEEFDAVKRKGAVILEPLLTDVVDVACHPTRAELVALGAGGGLQRWDMVTHACMASRTFPKMAGACVAYARDGSFLVAAFDGGYVHILSTADLQDIHVARNTPHAITRLTVSTTGSHIALADDSAHVLLYARLPYKHTFRWEFIGKCKSHHSPVVGLQFGESPDGTTRLLSVGADSRIAEYDLEKSSPTAGIKVSFHQDFAPPSLPTALCFAPPLQYYKHHSAETLLLVADDSYKVRLYNPDLRAAVSTFLGPTYGGPLSKLVMFKSATSEGAFLAYATAERVVGLIAWPMDGDPAKTLGLIAHPGPVKALAISYDGRKLVTAGTDGVLNVWDVSTTALEAQASASASRPDRWQRVLDNPELLDSMKDYFFYVQVKAQGEDCMAPRDVGGLVPTSAVPDLMRAAGFYPSEADITNIMHHIKHIAHARDLDQMSHIDFTTFLSLYINHRPLLDVSAEDIAAAFAALGAHPSSGKLSREALVTLLQSVGEAMEGEDLMSALQALTGAERLQDAMPASLDATEFSASVLGFDDGTGTAAAAQA